MVPELLSPLPQCTEPNQRIHADLFGPLKTLDGYKKFILCVTEAFTKYVELVLLPNKEALTVVSLTLVTLFFETSKPQANIYYALVGLECQA